MGLEDVTSTEGQSQIEKDRAQGLDAEMFWNRHGTPHVDKAQAEKLAGTFPGFVKSMGKVLAGEYYGAGGVEDFQVMKKEEVAEVARKVLKEDRRMLALAIEEGMNDNEVLAFVGAAQLPRKETAQILAELPETPSTES